MQVEVGFGQLANGTKIKVLTMQAEEGKSVTTAVFTYEEAENVGDLLKAVPPDEIQKATPADMPKGNGLITP